MQISVPHTCPPIRNRMRTHPSVVLSPGNVSITRTRSVERRVVCTAEPGPPMECGRGAETGRKTSCVTHGSALGGLLSWLVWGIGLRRLGCGCGRRLVTGSCVNRETTQTGCPWSWPRVSLSIYLSIYLSHLRAAPGQTTHSGVFFFRLFQWLSLESLHICTLYFHFQFACSVHRTAQRDLSRFSPSRKYHGARAAGTQRGLTLSLVGEGR